ncbi:MAG: ATP-binding protein [Armatimonadetes bacterium]|nr:ATP-binding protein [Armatimonadota bacterium]
MITLIEALNYRCLKYIRQPLGPFHVLVGPNASGKSTFLDVMAFLGTLVAKGLDAAIAERVCNGEEERSQHAFLDLVWRRPWEDSRPEGHWPRMGFAIESPVPAEYCTREPYVELGTVRYEVLLDCLPPPHSPRISWEYLYLTGCRTTEANGPAHCPRDDGRGGDRLPNSVFLGSYPDTHWRRVIGREYSGATHFEAETARNGTVGSSAGFFRIDDNFSALGALPPDQEQFPAATWLKRLLVREVSYIMLDLKALRAPSSRRGKRLQPDGSSTPWLLKDLLESAEGKQAYDSWLRHLQTVIPDLVGVKTVHRPEDNQQYLKLEYGNGLEVPSWIANDGALRLIALTLLTYLPGLDEIYLIEEPENGIHPRAIEAVYQSLSSIYDGQVLVTTHSPLLVGLAEPQTLLCFSKTPEGATSIVSGDRHPRLREWRREVDLGTLFAGGVLG